MDRTPGIVAMRRARRKLAWRTTWVTALLVFSTGGLAFGAIDTAHEGDWSSTVDLKRIPTPSWVVLAMAISLAVVTVVYVGVTVMWRRRGFVWVRSDGAGVTVGYSWTERLGTIAPAPRTAITVTTEPDPNSWNPRNPKVILLVSDGTATLRVVPGLKAADLNVQPLIDTLRHAQIHVEADPSLGRERGFGA